MRCMLFLCNFEESQILELLGLLNARFCVSGVGGGPPWSGKLVALVAKSLSESFLGWALLKPWKNMFLSIPCVSSVLVRLLDFPVHFGKVMFYLWGPTSFLALV